LTRSDFDHDSRIRAAWTFRIYKNRLENRGAIPYKDRIHPNLRCGMPEDNFASKKVVAGICGIFLGGLGVHKFILGMNTPGIIMLVVSLFTCGVPMGIVGLIEGIIYLTKSDEDFNQIYGVQKKEWF
jgi:TM2 domain-containing membrane protein YozV